MRFAFSATGGVSYHLIARRRSRSLWAPFRASVRSWLEPWADRVAGCNELIVFGPSAGWTLPLDLFARFSRVIFIEPDPVARFLLRRRLPKSVCAEFLSRADLLPWTSREAGVFERFLAEYPDAALLFSNVLGQIPLIAKRVDDAAQTEFLAAVSTRAWASYHDLYSGASASAVLRPSRDPGQVFAAGTVIDHETAWLERPTSQLALWPITEASLHVIEFVESHPSAGAR